MGLPYVNATAAMGGHLITVHLGGALAVFGGIISPSPPTASTHLENLHQARTRPPGPHQATRPAPGPQRCGKFSPYFFLAMIQFSSVNKACDFLTLKTKNTWYAKFEILHGKRFYFIWRADLMPFNHYHRTLICRGDKEQILQKLAKIANSPILPTLPTKALYRQTVSGSVVVWDEPTENF